MTARIYARVYHEIVDDPKFQKVYGNDAALATWLRMLLVADAMWPASAPLPRKTSAVRLLIEVGLIEERAGNRYVVKGLQAERERRSEIGRNAAAVRYQNERNANAVPTRAKQSRTEQSNGANAPISQIRPSFMAFPPKRPTALTDEEVASFRRTAASSRDPLIAENARETLKRHGIPVEVEA